MNSSYAYVYDDFLADRRYERDLAALETKLNTFDLAGRIGRMTLFRSSKDLVEGMVAQGARTIVIVGNDTSFEKVMWFMPNLPVMVGYLPLVGPSKIAEMFGIPVGIEACDILSARKIETLDMGKVNDRYFLTEISIPSAIVSLHIDKKYCLSMVNGGSLVIRNLGTSLESFSDPHDGLLEAVATSAPQETKRRFWEKKERPQETRILFHSGEIEAKDPVEAHVDQYIISGRQIFVGIEPQKLRCITGRSWELRKADGFLQKEEKDDTFRRASGFLKRMV